MIMPTDGAGMLEADDVDLKTRIDRQAFALFSGGSAKGGASEIVRMIGMRADQSAKRKLAMARKRASAAKPR